MFVFIVDQRPEEIKKVRFVVIIYHDFVDHLSNLDGDLLHNGLIIENVLIIIKQLCQQHDGFTIVSLL